MVNMGCMDTNFYPAYLGSILLSPPVRINSPEVAMALGELKIGKGFRSAKQAETTEQPSRKGGKAAVRSSVAAASIAKVLSGIDFLRYEKNAQN
jgi:hypothetical protein